MLSTPSDPPWSAASPGGGNATWKGATTWQVLASVLATAAQQQHDPVALLIGLLRKPGTVVAELAIPPRRGGP